MEDNEKKIYVDERKLLDEGKKISHQQFDKAILTVSIAGLGFSLKFLTEIFPKNIVSHKWILVSSWVSFSLSILLVVWSFITSQLAYKKALDVTEDLMIRKNESAFNVENKMSILTEKINIASAVFFTLAVILTVTFVSLNFMKG